MIRHSHIHLDIDEGIDRKELARLRGRFLSLNQTRLQRASSALSTRQQLVLRLLPLLFHVNHPLLPGYVSASTPAGLSGFEPDDDLLAEAQRLTRSFSYKPRRGNPPQPIQALFLMGSLGTVAQAEQSDLDLWVCHSPELSAAEVAELQRKCQQLEAWASGQGAELHCFLINPGTFSREDREARLTSDDCGTTQHYLLLDEFYRTAIWLGGRTPLWWLVPVKDEARYAEFTQALLSKRFVRADEVIDLGHLAHIPPSEFIGAGMWQLFKGIHSPFKSVLKLLLTEVYASEYPNTRCLSLRFKEAVFANQLDADELDPYMVIYRRLEEYLSQRGEQERLELVRRCLYLKVGKKLSKPPRNRKKSWQRLLLERLTADWNWDQRQWERLDARDSWKVRQVQSERRALVNELTYTYRFLAQFARQLQVASPLSGRDMGILGRRLYAAFERKAGKVEFINPGIAPDLAEELLSLVQCPSPEDDQEQQWALFAGSLAGSEWQDHSPIKRSRHLIELLAWAQRNGVIGNSSRISIQPGASDLNDFELSNLLGSLQHSFALPLPEVDDQALLEPSRPSEVLLLVNVGLDPLRQHSQQNIHMTSERTDSLGYAGLRENLVLSLDQVCLNSWNELQVSRYDSALVHEAIHITALVTLGMMAFGTLFPRFFASIGSALTVALLLVISLGIGPVRLSPLAVIEALFGGGSDVAQVIVREIRLPRTILAFAIGGILGLSGAALQGLLRNPLASPSLFGAPQSAAFGAVLVIALGLADVRSYALPVVAIIAAFGSVFALLAIAGRNAGLLILILAGLAISSFAGAATALVMNLSSNPFVVLEIAFWLLGSLEDRSFQHVALALPFIVAGAAILLSQANAFRTLTLGEEAAQSLGVDRKSVV